MTHPDGFAGTAHTVSAWADELRAAGLLAGLRYPTSYREMGRWGAGPACDAAEEVFRADSRAVLAHLAQPNRPTQRTLVTAHFVAITSAFLGSPHAGARWLIDHIPSAAPQPVERPQFAESVALAAYRTHLPGPHTHGITVDDVLTSLLPVHFVRHLAVNSAEEAVCLYLARAAALAFTARTRRRT